MPTITNDFQPDAVSALLDDWELTEKTVNDLVFIAVSHGYEGWDIDWEMMYPGDKVGYNGFIELLSQKLHEKGLKLSVTVQAQTGDNTDNPSIEAQDWQEISKYADQIRIMAYDFHYDSSEAGPITPLDAYQKVLNMAVQKIPLEKIIIGLPTYGYDWVGEKGVDTQYIHAIDRLTKLNKKWNRDLASAELVGKYTIGKDQHELWFEDAESAKIKIEMARSFGINRFCFWRLGGEDPLIWN
jgi:spore germination protein